MTTVTTDDYNAVFQEYTSNVGHLYPNVEKLQIHGPMGPKTYKYNKYNDAVKRCAA